MEACLPAYPFTVGLKSHALARYHGVELFQRFEIPVDDGFIDMNPEGLGRLKFGGVGRQIDEPDAVGHRQVRC